MSLLLLKHCTQNSGTNVSVLLQRVQVCLIGNSQTYQILKTVDNAETETQFPIKRKNAKAAGIRFILAKARFPVEKHEDESGAWQQRVK